MEMYRALHVQSIYTEQKYSVNVGFHKIDKGTAVSMV